MEPSSVQNGLQPLDWVDMTTNELAHLSFDSMYKDAVFIGRLGDYGLLHHISLYHEDDKIDSNIIWRCSYCYFWSFTMDQRIMEHLCTQSLFVPPEEKIKLKTYALDNSLATIEQLVN